MVNQLKEKSTFSEEEIGVGNITAYDPGDWLSKTIDKNGLEKDYMLTFEINKDFDRICKTVRDRLSAIFDEDDSNSDKRDKNSETLQRQHEAVIGNESAMEYFITRINDVLRNDNITSKNYPTFYDTLAEAVFHEVWGVSILHKWEKYPKSESAVIRGTELWIDIDGEFIKQKEEFSSNAVVERVKRTFTLRTKDAVINEQSPELEVEKEDGSRITMIQKPRSRDNYVMFRRFIVKDISLEEQAKLNTIREEDIPIFRSLSRVMANIIFAGRVRSAKSTFMKSIIRERSPNYVAGVLEKHFELGLSKAFPERLIFEIQAKEGDLHKAIPRLLRMEHDYIVVGEIRSLETEGYLQATERGERGALSTYHLTEVHHVVPQITRHILDEFPSRKFDNELERVARNVDIIVTMGTSRDRRKKRVIGVTEIIWDEEKRSYQSKDLIRYSEVTGRYYYHAGISKGLLLKMAEDNLEETKILVSLLKKREEESPMSDYHHIENNILDLILGDELDG